MPRAGRRRSVVWSCFVENAESGKRRVLCRFCQHDIVANPIRMVRHIVKHCPNADEHHKKICREYQTLTVPARRRGTDTSHTDEAEPAPLLDSTGGDPIGGGVMATIPSAPPNSMPTSECPSPSPSFNLNHIALHFPLPTGSMEETDVRHRVALDSRTLPSSTGSSIDQDRTQSKLRDLVHDEIVLAVATTGDGSLQLLENRHFCRALSLLHAKPLSAELAETHVLPRLCAATEEEATCVLRAATLLTIQLTAYSLHNDGRALEWFASDQDHRQVALGSTIHDLSPNNDAVVARLIHERLDQLPKKPQTPVLLCMDVSTTIATAATTATQPVAVAGCLMQASLSLLVAVVERVPAMKRAIEASTNVIDMLVRDPARLRQLQINVEPHAVHNGRLWSLVAVVDQVLRHKAAIQELLGDSSMVNGQGVSQTQFWVDVQLTSKLLRPFGFLLALSESGHLTSSLVLVGWLLVSATAVHSTTALSDAEKLAVTSVVVDHVREHGDPMALVCLLLDPRCRGLGLSALGKRKVRVMVAALALQLDPHTKQSHLLEQLVKFLNTERPFDDEGSWQMMASLPRLFWVEFMAEAPELASVALLSLGFRPYIRSLQDTWSTFQAAMSKRSNPACATNASTAIKLLAMQTKLGDSQARDYRKHVLEEAASVLLTDTPVGDDSQADDASALHADAVSSNGALQLWQQLRDVAESFLRRSHYIHDHGEDQDQDQEEAVTSTVNSVDASWFAVDLAESVAQLTACLHRALLGEMAYLRSSLINAHVDTSSAVTVGTESVSASAASGDALSGLMDL